MMFKKTLLTALLFCGFALMAHFPISVATEKQKGVFDVTFAPLQLGVFPDIQLFYGKTHTFAALALCGVMQESSLLSFAPVNGLKHNCFLQTGVLATVAGNNYGLSAALVNFAENNCGIELGFLGNINVEQSGIQIGAGNFQGKLQIGLYNIEGAFQIGVLNNGDGIQIGLLNYNPDAWIKWMPFINFPSPESSQKTKTGTVEK
ncbi:MAG: hypothetical protein E7051_00880 [Lentisphaerae bacterium]|nr:hypothetical protein [Lentisphaerota bacterium]